ncbi:MAG TPA: pseudouridine synthase [Solirubrobacterales bacterium]|nr:pseudouridine synthase [Solirubrobacterales bacterium]
MRLAKYLAHAGIASRRAAERMIAEGRVRVGGETVTDPARDVGEASGVEVDGRPVAPEDREVWAVNKPAGVVSTARTIGGHKNRRRIERRRAVTELVDSPRRLYPVGRLDADSTGLILLTNDGELANRLTHPRYRVPKTYRVELARPPAERDLERLRRGVRLDDGVSAPAEVVRRGEREIEITIREGRKRQVRRMAEAVGNRVSALTRVRLGPIELGELGRGDARRLEGWEVAALWEDSAP